jgi:hypothetical protein
MAASAAALWAVNGTVSKIILASGISSLRLPEVRMTGAVVGFVIVLLAIAPGRLKVRRRELAVWGIGGLALVQWLYFLAIHRLAIGIALLIEYVAPLIVALWARYVFHERVRRRMGGFTILGAFDLVQDLVSLVDPRADLLLPGKARRVFQIPDDASILEMQLRGEIELNQHAAETSDIVGGSMGTSSTTGMMPFARPRDQQPSVSCPSFLLSPPLACCRGSWRRSW